MSRYWRDCRLGCVGEEILVSEGPEEDRREA